MKKDADRPTLLPKTTVTPAMIEAGATVLWAFDRLEMSPSYARILTEEILTKSLSAR
ncbi:MAG: hypothetical protein H7X89_07600 [Rhizobiales bacterium]|nr:hypothetical protein [Hyphomicrobiales bacterium]